MTLGWAILSTGRHPDLKIAPALNATPGARLVAVYSRDRQRAEAFADKHGAAAAYDALPALLRDPRVEAVFLCSPNALHAEQALLAAQAGKHVLTEKPMTTTLSDAIAMVRGCREAGVKLGVGFHLRQHPAHQEARRLVAAGTLGTIALAQGQWGFGVRGQVMPPPRQAAWQQWWDDPALIGGASTMMGTGVHVVDVLRFVLGAEITEVAAIADGQTPQQPLEQVLAMSVRLTSGTIATVCCGRRLPDSRNDLVLYGSQGRLVSVGTLWESREGSLEVVSDSGNTALHPPADRLANYVDEILDFQQAIADNREPAATGLDGLRVVQVTLAMITSARQKRTVHVTPLSV